MKITIYTITDCQFSKQEKEYLKAHNLPYEEKNLETNKDFLTEMLAISNNFAGTPVTRIEKDNGVIRVFKGFTKEEFDEFFGFSQPQQQTIDQTNQTSSQPDSNSQTTQQSFQQPEPTLENQTENPNKDNPLNDVLSQLEQKVEDNPQQDLQTPTTNEPQSLNTTPTTQEETPFQQPTNPVEETSPLPQNIPQIPDFPQDNK